MKLKRGCIIADIPYKGLREVATQRLYQWNHVASPKGNSVSDFNWSNSPEGYTFWKYAYHGNYDGRFEKQILKRI